jgi:hypothetical protein
MTEAGPGKPLCVQNQLADQVFRFKLRCRIERHQSIELRSSQARATANIPIFQILKKPKASPAPIAVPPCGRRHMMPMQLHGRLFPAGQLLWNERVVRRIRTWRNGRWRSEAG